MFYVVCTWEFIQLHAIAAHLQNLRVIRTRDTVAQRIQRTLVSDVLIGGDCNGRRNGDQMVQHHQCRRHAEPTIIMYAECNRPRWQSAANRDGVHHHHHSHRRASSSSWWLGGCSMRIYWLYIFFLSIGVVCCVVCWPTLFGARCRERGSDLHLNA